MAQKLDGSEPAFRRLRKPIIDLTVLVLDPANREGGPVERKCRG